MFPEMLPKERDLNDTLQAIGPNRISQKQFTAFYYRPPHQIFLSSVNFRREYVFKFAPILGALQKTR
jgi:hypothetical protein